MSSIQGNVFQSDIGAKEGKEGFIGLLFGHLGRMSFALNNSELGSNSANIYYNSYLIIHHIPDAELRKELVNKLKRRVEELHKEGKNEDESLITASIEVVGDVMDHIDEMLGIEKRSKISIELDCESCKYKRKATEFPEEEEIIEKESENPDEISEDFPISINDLSENPKN